MTEIQIASTDAAVSAVGRRTLLWRRFLRNKPAIAGVCVLVLLFVGSFVGPYLLPYDYQQLDYTALLQPPSANIRSAPTRSARTFSPRRCAGCRSR